MTDTKRVRTEKEECFDYHKEYFTNRIERDERIITLIDEDCRIEKEVSDSDYHDYCIGVFISL